MPLISGFGNGPFGQDPFGETSYARLQLLENLPEVYRDADKENDLLFEKFIRALFPNTNEFRDLLDRFPLIRDAENIPGDSITFLSLVEDLKPEIQIVEETLPFVIPSNQVTIIGDDPNETLTVTVTEVQNDLSRIRIGTNFPFATSIRQVRVRDETFSFLVTNGSDFMVAVPEVCPDIKTSDFIQIGDVRHVVTAINQSLLKITLFPSPTITPSIERRELTRLSRLILLTLLAKDIGFTDDPTKLEDIRRGLVLHAVEYYKLKGTRKGYQVKGALEGLIADVFTFQETPCVSTTCEFVPITIGSITAAAGSSITDGKIITIDDSINPAKTFEFDKDGSVTPGNVAIPITDALTATQVATAIGDAINAESPFSVNAFFESDAVIVDLRNEDAGLAGEITITTDSGLAVDGMKVFNGVACETEKKTLDPLLYLSEFDEVPLDVGTFDSPSMFKYFDLGDRAAGSVTAVAGLSIVEGETFTLNDGENPAKTFEFDKTATVVSGNVPVLINDGMTAVDVAIAIQDAINSIPEQLRITATHAFGTDVVNLVNDTSGNTTRNITITDTVVDAGFIVSGMSGGTSIEDEIEVPVRFADFNLFFSVVGINFLYDPGPGADQITLRTEADLLVGDIVEFGLQQKTVTAVPGATPIPEFPGLRTAGTVITFDNPLVGLTPISAASRVTRFPDIDPARDFITIAGFDYKVVQFDSAAASGTADLPLRDLALVDQIVVGTRTRRRAVTRRQAFDFCRLPALKLTMKAVPESIFFVGFESVTRFVSALDEVRPIHVRFEDIQFEQESTITVPVPRVGICSTLTSEAIVPVDNHYDALPADETPTDATKVVTVETP